MDDGKPCCLPACLVRASCGGEARAVGRGPRAHAVVELVGGGGLLRATTFQIFSQMTDEASGRGRPLPLGSIAAAIEKSKPERPEHRNAQWPI